MKEPPMPVEIVEARRKTFLQEAEKRGCTIKKNKSFYRIDGRHSSKHFNVAKNGTKVTLNGFFISHPSVMAMSPEDARDLHISGVSGIFDFLGPSAPQLMERAFAEIWADR